MSMMEVAMLTSGNGAGAKLYTEETFENNDGWGFQHTTVMQNFAVLRRLRCVNTVQSYCFLHTYL